MRILILVVLATTCWLVPTMAQDEDGKPKETAADAIFKELAAGLPRGSQRADSARLELE